MLDSFLVVLEDTTEALIPYAFSAARTLGAQLTAVFPRRDPLVLEDGSIETRLEVASGLTAQRKVIAHDRLEVFAAAAKAASVPVDTLFPEVGQDPPRDLLPRFARAFDFTLVQQHAAGHAPLHDDFAANLLAESGRPVWAVPAVGHEGAGMSRIVVAWDGGAEAARAFGEARRLIEKAERVEIVTVVDRETQPAVLQGGERLAARLRRAGIEGRFHRLPNERDAGGALLSFAADLSADLMICGGYSHSRLRERLFGGVTHTLLTSMTLPLFLAH